MIPYLFCGYMRSVGFEGFVFNPLFVVFAMAKIRRIGHDHEAPFWHLLVVLLLEVSSGDAKRKQAATCTIHLGPPIFLQILDPL